MRNVAGISQTDAQKSSDMFMKCRYMDELTGGRGITFATGTPVSNSMTELYTIMRYLQYDTLMRMGMGHFDSWAATLGKIQHIRSLNIRSFIKNGDQLWKIEKTGKPCFRTIARSFR